LSSVAACPFGRSRTPINLVLLRRVRSSLNRDAEAGGLEPATAAGTGGVSDRSAAQVGVLTAGVVIGVARIHCIVEASVTWNYTTVLNIIFLGVAATLVGRFVRTGGMPMLRMMDKPMGEHT
jgi:hypothetical protein